MGNPLVFLVVSGRTLLGIFFLFLILFLNTLAGFLFPSHPVLAPIYQGPPLDQVAITVNVDWGEEHLPAMLEILAEHTVRVTFFLTGTFLDKFPHLVQKMVDGGHELGNHGAVHVHPNLLSREEMVALIQDNGALITEKTGVKTHFFAPPYGEYNEALLEVAQSLHYQVILWTVDSVDWQRPGSQVIRDRVLQGIEPGAIILIHPLEQTVDALEEMIIGIKEKGLTPVTLSSLLRD